MGAEGVDWERLLSEYLMIFQKAVIKNVRFRAQSRHSETNQGFEIITSPRVFYLWPLIRFCT
jgi:hypothetical protein